MFLGCKSLFRVVCVQDIYMALILKGQWFLQGHGRFTGVVHVHVHGINYVAGMVTSLYKVATCTC